MKHKLRSFFTQRVLSNLLIICLGVTFYLLLSNFEHVSEEFLGVVGLFSPFIIGMALAYFLNLPMRAIEKKFLYKIKKKKWIRPLSITIVYALSAAILGVLLVLILPQLIDSVLSLINNIPLYLENLTQFAQWITQRFDLEPDTLDFIVVSYTELVQEVIMLLRTILPDLLDWSVRIGSGVITGLTAVMASIYMLASKEKLQMQGKKVMFALLKPKVAKSILRTATLSNRIFSGFISGKFIDSVIIGIICYLFMSITNAFFYTMPQALLISLIIGVTNIIPFFGPFIGAIPSVFLLLLINPGSALVFSIFVIVLQQFDGNILGPKILGDSTGLPAFWVLVAIIVGGDLFGFLGMILGVPTAAVFYVLFRRYINKRLRIKGLDENGNLVHEKPISLDEQDVQSKEL